MDMLIETTRKSRCGGLLQLLALVMLLAGSKGAWAAASCSGGGQAYTITMPSTVTVPRDVPNGTVLATFYYSTAVGNIWSCSASGSTATGAGFQGNNGIVTTYTIAGKSVPVHSTSIPGVGIAFDVKENANGCSWLNYNENQNPTNGYAWGACNSNGNVVNGLQIGVALVKTGPIAGGLLNPGIVGYGAAYNNGSIPSGGTSRVSYGITPVQINVLACTTPDVLVPLGTHSSTEMASVGAGTNPVAFAINLNGCPAGMNSVQYRIDPATTVVNSSLSLVALNAGSSASGVAVQLLNSAGTAAYPMSSYQAFGGYSKSTGGSYTIPFKARYYRTGAISPGTANTSMTFTMQYL